jgi:hypothetical protein
MSVAFASQKGVWLFKTEQWRASLSLARAMAMMMLWRSLPDDVRAAVEKAFVNPMLLQAAFDNKKEARDLLEALLNPPWPEQDLDRAADELEDWRQRMQGSFKRARLSRLEPLLTPTLNNLDIHTCLQDRYESLVSSSVVLARRVCKTSLSKSLKQEGVSRKELEDKERTKWALLLAEWIEEAGLPITIMVKQTPHPVLTWQRIFGSRRAKTLRNRARAWRNIRTWMMCLYEHPFPSTLSQMLNYLEERALEPCGRSVPDAIAAALGVMESVGKVADPISKDLTWQATVDFWRTNLETGNTGKSVAETFTVAMIISLELFVATQSNLEYLRAITWLQLVMHWACLRADDVQGIDPARLSLTDACFRGVLTRTKTTGPGKKTLEVPFYVSRLCNLSGRDWMLAGFKIWTSDQYSKPRDFLVMAPSADWGHPIVKFLLPTDLNAYFKHVLMLLGRPIRPTLSQPWTVDEVPLVHPRLVTFWKGHGPRHWLPSVSAAMGYRKEQRDFLGRWGLDKHQSNDYVLTSRQVILEVQEGVTQGLLEGTRSYDETELISKIRLASDEAGLDGNVVAKLHTALLKTAHGKWSLINLFPALQLDQLEQAEVLEAEMPSMESQLEPPPTSESKYWVSVSTRTGFRRLHYRNAYGCSVTQLRCRSSVEVETISPGVADALCKDCDKYMKRQGLQTAFRQKEESSSSGSSSSGEENNLSLAATNQGE